MDYNSQNNPETIAKEIQNKLMEYIAPDVVMNNSWHDTQDCREHCSRTLSHMAANLSFTFVRDREKRNELVSFFAGNYKNTTNPRLQLLLIASLWHDIGIPKSLITAEDAITTNAPNHGPIGADLAREKLYELGFSEEAISYIYKLIKYHMAAHKPFREGSLSGVWQFVGQFKPYGLDLILLGLADTQASDLEKLNKNEYDRRITLYHTALNQIKLPTITP